MISLDESPVNALIPYNAMKLYALKRFDLKSFEIFKNAIADHTRFLKLCTILGFLVYLFILFNFAR